MLPQGLLPTATVTVNNEEVEIRSLSRSDALALQAYQGKEAEAESFILSKGTGVTRKEAQAWLDSTNLESAGVVIDAILDLSGLTNADPKVMKAVKTTRAVRAVKS